MVILHDPTWQFIITTSTTIIISLITFTITIWFTVKKPTIPIGFENIDMTYIAGGDNIKEIKEKMHVSDDGNSSTLLCLLTLKIWNTGKETIQLPKPTPLIVRFKEGVKILGWDNLKCEPDYIKVTPSTKNREVIFDLPLLAYKQSILLRVLLSSEKLEIIAKSEQKISFFQRLMGFYLRSNYTDYLVDIYAEVPQRIRTIKANNIRSSKENRLVAIITLFIFIYFSVSVYSSQKSPSIMEHDANIMITAAAYFILSLMFLLWSYIERKTFPHHMSLPSEIVKQYLRSFLSVLPVLIIVIIIFFAIYHFFGKRLVVNCIMTLILLFYPSFIWFAIYQLMSWALKKLKSDYNSILLAAVTSMVPILVLTYMVPLILFEWNFM